jgi:hypothetical protein
MNWQAEPAPMMKAGVCVDAFAARARPTATEAGALPIPRNWLPGIVTFLLFDLRFLIEGLAMLSRDAATRREATQVVAISSETTESCVVSSLISRRLRGNQGFFEGFLTLKWVDFSALRDIMPFFLPAKPCTRNPPPELFLAKNAKDVRAIRLRRAAARQGRG